MDCANPFLVVFLLKNQKLKFYTKTLINNKSLFLLFSCLFLLLSFVSAVPWIRIDQDSGVKRSDLSSLDTSLEVSLNPPPGT
jgi:hypothetical protein